MNAIETRKLTKNYGAGRGLIDLDLTVGEGEVFGFLGPNGAGKTTTIRLLMDMIRPTRGEAHIFGLDTRGDSVAIKKIVGYLPGETADFGSIRGAEVVGYMMGMRRMDDDRRAREICERLDLDLSQRFREYSRGNKQKLGLVLALMHDPRLLILDEPTAGLDPLMQQEFYALLAEARARGATTFMSSHVLSEVEHVCERAAIIRDARLVETLELDDLRDIQFHRVEMSFSGDVPLERLRAVAGLEDLEVEDGKVRGTVRGSFEPLLAAIAGTGVVNLTSHEPTLEEMFLGHYADAGDDDTG